MPRSRKSQSEPTLARAGIGLLIVIAAIVAMRMGAFNIIGELLVNYSLDSMREETDRQRAEFDQRQAERAAAQETAKPQ